jgi:DNA polymerase-3 subunit epsilon
VLGQRLRRMWYAKKVAGTTLHNTWRCHTPGLGDDWRDVSFLVCDGEMSSLDANQGELLSLGWVVIERGAIVLESARHYLVKAKQSVGQSAAIHQLRDCELEEGRPAAQLLELFLAAAAGRVLVFHNATLDTAFLDRLTCREYGAPLLMPTVDTMLMEEVVLRRSDRVIKTGDLRLHACRQRYNLPRYSSHNALVDALATAELLLAQTQRCGGSNNVPLRYFL